MNLVYRLSILCLLSIASISCENIIMSAKGSTLSDSIPDSSALKLIAMGEQAMQIAQQESSDVVLRQVETDLSITAFRFVDGALTKEIVVIVPESGRFNGVAAASASDVWAVGSYTDGNQWLTWISRYTIP